jgi:hypothetical protein
VFVKPQDGMILTQDNKKMYSTKILFTKHTKWDSKKETFFLEKQINFNEMIFAGIKQDFSGDRHRLLYN